MHITVYFHRGKKAPFITLLCIALVLCILVPLLCSRCYVTPNRPDTPQVYGVPLHQMLMEEGSAGRPGTHRTIRYIVIHETANTNVGADAQAHAQLLQSGKNGTTSWHYSVDVIRSIRAFPTMKWLITPGINVKRAAVMYAASASSFASIRTAILKRPSKTALN